MESASRRSSKTDAFEFYTPRKFNKGTKRRFERVNRRALVAEHFGGRKPIFDARRWTLASFP